MSGRATVVGQSKCIFSPQVLLLKCVTNRFNDAKLASKYSLKVLSVILSKVMSKQGQFYAHTTDFFAADAN